MVQRILRRQIHFPRSLHCLVAAAACRQCGQSLRSILRAPFLRLFLLRIHNHLDLLHKQCNCPITTIIRYPGKMAKNKATKNKTYDRPIDRRKGRQQKIKRSRPLRNGSATHSTSFSLHITTNVRPINECEYCT